METPHPYPELTVRENLEVVRRLRKHPDVDAVDRIIKQPGLSAYADRPTRTLSLGNAQRLGLASALLHSPSVLILDEPSNGLDPSGTVEIRELMKRLSRSSLVSERTPLTPTHFNERNPHGIQELPELRNASHEGSEGRRD